MICLSIRAAAKKSFEPLGIGTSRQMVLVSLEFVEFVKSFSEKIKRIKVKFEYQISVDKLSKEV